MKKTIVFDFDGVIHSYISGWKGTTVIPDEPVPGIKEAIDSIRSEGYEVVIVSTRTASMEGLSAVTDWLNKYGIVVDAVSAEKPPALVYIDDRAICFDGDPSSLLDKIKTFQPWHKRKKTNFDLIKEMSAEELAEKLAGRYSTYCENCMLNFSSICEDDPLAPCKDKIKTWLLSEVENE